MSESGTAGYIASFPIPEVVRGINAFLLGAQTIDPDFKLKVVWVSTWFDPGKEADAAKVLIGQGADIIVQHTDSTAPLQIAEEQGVVGFGQASDMFAFAPNAQLTAIIDEWAPYYVARTRAVLDGTWESTDTWDGIAPGMVKMAEYTNMPEEVEGAGHGDRSDDRFPVSCTRSRDRSTTRKATMVIGEGEVLDDGTLLGMNWYVQGVDDKLPG